MNWYTALMCNEIWWMIITQIKVLCNNSHMFYKMALKTDFHKYFQCSLVDDKNTKLFFIIYAINLKTCFCTVETETTLLESRADETLKSKVSESSVSRADDRSLPSPLVSALLQTKTSATLKDLRHNSNIFLKIRCFIHTRKYLKEK